MSIRSFLSSIAPYTSRVIRRHCVISYRGSATSSDIASISGHGVAAVTVDHKRLAILIDGDNATPYLLHGYLKEAGNFGKISIKRVYGDWTNQNMSGWKSGLNTHAIR